MHGRFAARVAWAGAAFLSMLLFLAVPQADAAWQRGANFTTRDPDAFGTVAADTSLARLKADGSDSVEIVTTWYQQTPLSNTIAPDSSRTPTDASLLHAMQRARSLGLRVTLKPHVNVDTGAWRGTIAPTDPVAWWQSYGAMIDHYATLAQQGGASMFVVGTELKSMSGDSARWRALIADVRTRFAGALTYAAGYSEFDRVQFWDALDYIGVDAYFALTNTIGDSAATLAWHWTSWGWKAKLVNTAFTYGKPVLFTEIGYRSTPDTALHPGLWTDTGTADFAAQQRAYEAFYEAFQNEGWFAGVYWWRWPADLGKSPGWEEDYPPVDKPAEQTMKFWNTTLG